VWSVGGGRRPGPASLSCWCCSPGGRCSRRSSAATWRTRRAGRCGPASTTVRDRHRLGIPIGLAGAAIAVHGRYGDSRGQWTRWATHPRVLVLAVLAASFAVTSLCSVVLGRLLAGSGAAGALVDRLTASWSTRWPSSGWGGRGRRDVAPPAPGLTACPRAVNPTGHAPPRRPLMPQWGGAGCARPCRPARSPSRTARGESGRR
jgi:hypothetical protein